MTETVPEIGGTTCGSIAADLRRIADAFDAVPHVEITSTFVQLGIQPGGSDEQVIARTDAISEALFGTPGKPQKMGSGYHYNAEGKCGVVHVEIYDSIDDPDWREREAEVERLRARVAELEAGQ